jgi:hypothetical protein
MRKLPFLVTFLLVALACSGGSTSIDITKYDRTCKNALDCVLVATDACCGCQTSSINSDSLAQFQSDLAAAKKNCGSTVCPPIQCVSVMAGCQAGLCISQMASPPMDASTD